MDKIDFDTLPVRLPRRGLRRGDRTSVATGTTTLATHTHPFSVKARVVQGEMWLTVQDETRHLQAGDGFELEREVAHAERYGPSGATYWVARKHG